MVPKITNSISWLIGGAQGSGVDSAANIFSRACALGGLNVFGKREYYSNIKGEHSYFAVRISDKPIRSHVDHIDILVSFDSETVFRHADNVVEGGIIIYDSESAYTNLDEIPTIDRYANERLKKMLSSAGKQASVQGILDYAKDKGVIIYKIPYFHMLKEFAESINDASLSKLTRMINVMAVSASMTVMDFDFEILSQAIRHVFRAKSKVAELNVKAARFIHEKTKIEFDGKASPYKISCSRPSLDTILVQGNQSSAMGKIAAGCRFQTYYPITPASDDSEYLESNQIIKRKEGKDNDSIIVVQTEDEIAALTMAIGGALTGIRSATATSGPGFSLMAEALGWASINEVPVVISLYQRAGPSTGLPTRHEQGDLMFAINCGHGEFPKIVYASGDIEESFYDTIRVFNYAERYQMPAIHLLDKAIANSVMTCKEFDQNKISLDRGNLINKVNPDENSGQAGHYLRFKLGNPLSTRVPLGTENGIFWNTGDEHTEEGHITEDPEVRVNMVQKRFSKLDIALKEIPDTDKIMIYGNASQKESITIVSWGSTKGAILDAIERISQEGHSVRFIQVKLMNPFPTELLSNLLKNTSILVDIEMNYTSQLGQLIEQKIHRTMDYKIIKFNGRPMSCSELYNSLMSIIRGMAPRRIVLKHGT